MLAQNVESANQIAEIRRVSVIRTCGMPVIIS